MKTNWYSKSALALLVAGLLSTNAFATSIGVVGNTYGNEVSNLNSMVASGLPSGSSFTVMTGATFDATSIADLRSSYDVLLFTWPGVSANTDWASRILPFLSLGGGVIFDGSADAPGGASGLTYGGGGGSMAISAVVPGLTDGITNDFANYHVVISSFDASWNEFISFSSGGSAGVYGEIGGGRIIVTGPDQFFHGDPTYDVNQYNLGLNELTWVSGASVPDTGSSILLFSCGLGMIAFFRRRLAK